MGGDSVEGILDKSDDWDTTNGTLDNLSESPDYVEMMDAIFVLSGLDSDLYDYDYSDGLYAFYEYYNAAAYYFEQVNPNYTVQEIMDYLSNQSAFDTIDTFMSDGSSAYKDIAQYYDDAGYTVDPDNGEFLSPNEQYIKFDLAKPDFE